jgi:hypothetical protein
MKTLSLPIFAILFTLFLMSCDEKKVSSSKVEEIKAYNLDFNWGEGGSECLCSAGFVGRCFA